MRFHKDSYEIKKFESSSEWRKWLFLNHATSPGIWLKIYKKASRARSISYSEALDEALCFGWIDGQKDRFDTQFWLQRFSVRRAKSLWSKVNTEKIGRLREENKIMPPGLEAVEAAKKDGRWDRAYDSQRNMIIPQDFLEVLSRNPKAMQFFHSLNRTNLYSIVFRLQTAGTPSLREKRIESIISRLSEERKYH